MFLMAEWDNLRTLEKIKYLGIIANLEYECYHHK